SPFFAKDNFLSNNYDNPEVDKLISDQRGMTEVAERTKAIEELQTMVAKDLSTLPLLQGAQVAVAGEDVKDVDKTFDASFKFRLGVLTQSPCSSLAAPDPEGICRAPAMARQAGPLGMRRH